MTAVKRPLYIEQGATFRLGFNWHKAGPLDVDGNPTPGDPYDLTGATARMQIRKKQGQPVLADASTSNGKIVLGGANGRVDVTLSDEDTDLLTSKSCVYDLEIVLVGAEAGTYRLFEGAVEVSPNTTQESDDPVVR